MKRIFFVLLYILVLLSCNRADQRETFTVASREYFIWGDGMALITPIVKSTGSTEWERVDDIKGFVFEAGYECVITAIRQQSNHMNYIDYPGTGIYLDDIILVSKTKKESDGMDIRKIWNSKWPITYNPYNPECNSEEYNLKYGSWADGYPDPDPFE